MASSKPSSLSPPPRMRGGVGGGEHRRNCATPLLDGAASASYNPEVAFKCPSPFSHRHFSQMLDINALFDETYYLATNSDVAAAVTGGAFQSGFKHFQEYGQFEKRNPSALFDTRDYLANNPDVAAAVSSNATTAVRHFIDFGQTEGRNPSTLYNNTYYLTNNSDVAAAVDRDEITGIEHFIKHGQFEKRKLSPLYSDSYYLAKNPDVAAAVGRDELTGMQHYLKYGALEKREFTPFVEPGWSTLPNGVASGDTTQTSTVLWTRTTVPGTVSFQYSTDSNFNTVLGTQTATATDPAVPVKVQVAGLTPGTQYFYRITDAGGTSAVGQFRTPAALGTRQGLRFGVSGDWQGELAPYPSISNAPERNLDFFVQMGDTVESDSASPDLPGVRQAKTQEDFRTKHNEIYSQRFGFNPWADLRSATTTYATWDDHEITNDFAGGAAPAQSPQKEGIFGTGSGFVNDTPVFDAALKAFQEFKPLRDEFYGSTGDDRTEIEQKLYRFNTHGSDAATFVLDLRSFRDAPLTNIPETADAATVNQFLADSFNPNRTILGTAQLQQFKNDLLVAQQAGITWKFVMSTVPMQHFGIPVAGERWESYAAERTDLLRFIEDNNIENVVFVTGDFHGTVVNNVTYQEGAGQPQIPTGAFDVMVGSVGIQLNIGQGPFAAPFGTATVAFTPAALLPQSEKDRYNALPTREEKDAFIRNVLDTRTAPLGYDPVGLEGSEIDAQILQGSYVAAHTYGWTEFEIDPQTQQLLVTTWGVEPYTQTQLEANPTPVANQTPTIVSQFVVNPKA
ncbi:MAG: alkaline phosphatase D family protein [Oscillatoria sp. Prado101]|nr:alkaline phosphatase D family protein [Oscillatoria sp. Prado101]